MLAIYLFLLTEASKRHLCVAEQDGKHSATYAVKFKKKYT